MPVFGFYFVFFTISLFLLPSHQVAGAVTFLLSPAAAYITGTTIDVDGASSKVYASIFPSGNNGP